MKLVIVGGTGRIGSKVVAKLRDWGHEATAASPDTGVNTLTGEGLAKALQGASAVVDVSNAPSWEDVAVMNFFETSTRHLLAQEAAAGVAHHVALSVVASDRLTASGYFRAKIVQEALIMASAVPHSIVRATQFFEFVKPIANQSMVAGKVRLPPVLFQPMAADDVASAVAAAALDTPENGITEVCGPEMFRLDELVRRALIAYGDPREVVSDPKASYYGIVVQERTLLPARGAKPGKIRFEGWLAQELARGRAA